MMEMMCENHTEVIEFMQDIKARLDSGAKAGPSKSTANGKSADSSSSGCCEYLKRDGSQCIKRPKAGTKYCPEHPGGMTKVAAKKAAEAAEGADDSKKPELKMSSYEDNEDYDVIDKPNVIQNVLVTSAKPHRALFKVGNGNKYEPLDDTLLSNLKKFKITPASETEITEAVEQLGGQLKNTKPKAKTATSTGKDKKVVAPASGSESEEEVKEKGKVKVVAALSKGKGKKDEVETKARNTKDSDDEEEKPAKGKIAAASEKAVSKVTAGSQDSLSEANVERTNKVPLKLKQKASKKPASSDEESGDE
jgi:hypothetical protein